MVKFATLDGYIAGVPSAVRVRLIVPPDSSIAELAVTATVPPDPDVLYRR